MSAIHQPRSGEYSGYLSFVIHSKHSNNPLLAPQPELVTWWGLDNSVPESEKEAARQLLTRFVSLVKEKFDEETPGSGRKLWMQLHTKARSTAVRMKLREWYPDVRKLINDVHFSHASEFAAVGWELYTHRQYERYLKTFKTPRDPFRTWPYDNSDGYSGRVHQQVISAPVPSQISALPSIPHWLDPPPVSSPTPSRGGGSYPGAATTLAAAASPSAALPYAAFPSEDTAAVGSIAAQEDHPEVSPIEADSDGEEALHSVWSPSASNRCSMATYEVSPI